MSENSLKIAADYLAQAKKTIETRAHEHGDAFNSFTMVAQLWSIFLTNTNVARHGNTPLPIHLDAVDVAEMMSLLKKARKVHGAQGMPEGPIDDLGYTALAGALAAELEGSKPAPELYVRPSYAEQGEKQLDAQRGLQPKVKPT